jgi:hypothetical protein
VRARIPPEWTFRVWIGKNSARAHVRPGFARVAVRASTTIEQLVEGVAERAGVDPEQIVLGLNRTTCLRTGAGATDQQLLLAPRASSPSASSARSDHEVHLDALEAKLTVPLRRRATVAEARLFSIRHCVLLTVLETMPTNAVDAMRYIDADTECVLFAPRCATRERRLGACQQKLGVKKCMWQLLLFDACTRVCLMLDEPTPVPLLSSDHLPAAASQRTAFLSGRNLEMIPGQSHWTRCERCAIAGSALVLFDPYSAYEERESGGVNTETSKPRVLRDLHGKPMMVSRHHPYMVMDMSSIINRKVVPEALLEGAAGRKRRRDGDGGEDGDSNGEIKVVFLNDDDDADSNDEYACTRRFVRPAYIVSVWSVTNVFHLLWDLFFPMLVKKERKVARLAAHAKGAHLFLDVGHPDQRRRWHRLLHGDMSPSADAPAKHVLSAFTGGLPVHSSAYLESLPGVSCFEDLSAGVIYETGPLNYAIVMAGNGYTHWSALTTNSATHESTAAGREAIRLRRAFSQRMDKTMERVDGSGPMSPSFLFETMRQDALRRLPRESRQRRALLDMFGLGYAGAPLLSPLSAPPARRSIVFVDRKGSREILNLRRLVEIARERVETGMPGGQGGGATALTMGAAGLVGRALPFDIVRVALEHLPFREQLELFRSTAILVAAHGQGAANAAFLPPRGQSALVLAMPPGWFGWHWVYANTAVSVEVHAVVLQRASDGPVDGWSGKDNDRVNAARDKKFDVDPGLFEDGLECALELVTRKEEKEDEVKGTLDDPWQYGVDVHYVLGEERLDFMSGEVAV